MLTGKLKETFTIRVKIDGFESIAGDIKHNLKKNLNSNSEELREEPNLKFPLLEYEISQKIVKLLNKGKSDINLIDGKGSIIFEFTVLSNSNIS